MKISCQNCKNYVSINCIDIVEYSCKFRHEISWEKRECKDGKSKYVSPSEDYKKGYIHGYNQCRKDVENIMESLKPKIPEEIINPN